MAKAKLIKNYLNWLMDSTERHYDYLKDIKKVRFSKEIRQEHASRFREFDQKYPEAKILPFGLKEMLAKRKDKEKYIKNTVNLYKAAAKLPVANRIFILDRLYKEIQNQHQGMADRLLNENKMLINVLTPQKKFKITHFPTWRFPDGEKMRGAYVFSVRGFGAAAVFQIYLQKGRMQTDFMQGIKGADMRKAKKKLGQAWYETLTEYLIKSHQPLKKTHTFYIRPTKNPTFGKIRDRYLSKDGYLNPRKNKSKKILEQMQ